MGATRSPRPQLKFPNVPEATRVRGVLDHHATMAGAMPNGYPDPEPGTNEWTVPSSNNPGWLDREPAPGPRPPAEWMNDISLRTKGIEVYPARDQAPRMGLETER